MNEKHLNIVEQAFKLFIHYGVSKTSMTEIAAAAKVARQTVYKAFDSKEDLVFAALLHYGIQTKAAVEQDCASATDIGDRLDVMYKHMVQVPFEAMQAFPHLDEVLEISESFSHERKTQVKAAYLESVALVLSPWKQQLESNGVNLAQLCEMVKSTFTQIKRDARDEDNLMALFAPLRALLIQGTR